MVFNRRQFLLGSFWNAVILIILLEYGILTYLNGRKVRDTYKCTIYYLCNKYYEYSNTGLTRCKAMMIFVFAGSKR